MQVLLAVCCTSALTLILHAIGLEFYLYWTYWWFDIVTHALGGFSVGLLSAFIFFGKYLRFLFVVLILLILGWEFFEVYVIGIDIYGASYVIDTFLDIAVSLIFAYVAALLYRLWFDRV